MTCKQDIPYTPHSIMFSLNSLKALIDLYKKGPKIKVKAMQNQETFIIKTIVLLSIFYIYGTNLVQKIKGMHLVTI